MAKWRVAGLIAWAGVVMAGFAVRQPVWAQSQQHAAAIAGYWTTDARWQSTIRSRTRPESFWIGRMWGRIDATGKLRFDADNGCSALGLLQPYIAGGSWQGSVSVMSCRVSDMNGRYGVMVSGGRPHLALKFSDTRPAAGSVVGDEYEVVGTFARYDPLGTREDEIARAREKSLSRMLNGESSQIAYEGVTSGYRSRVIAAIAPNILFPQSVPANATVEVEIAVKPDGTILGVRVAKSSGAAGWDDAVLAAVGKTRQLPLDNGRIPPRLNLSFPATVE